MIDTGPGREHMRQDLMETFSARWTGEEETLTKGRLWPGADPCPLASREANTMRLLNRLRRPDRLAKCR